MPRLSAFKRGPVVTESTPLQQRREVWEAWKDQHGNLEQCDKEEAHRAWEEMKGEELEPALSSGAIALLDAHWLVSFAYENESNILPCRQQLPSEAFLSLDQVICSTTENELSNKGLNIIMLSYMWLHPLHPDPKGETLQFLAKRIHVELHNNKRTRRTSHRWAVFWDYASLYQHPGNGLYRNKQEQELFEVGLDSLATFFSHPYTSCFKITKFPPGYPDRYDLPETANSAVYEERGWPCFESFLVNMSKDMKKTCDISLQSVGSRNRWKRGAPMIPDRANKQFMTVSFTNTKDDRPLVMRLYEAEFPRRFASVQELYYVSLGWGDEELECASEVIASGCMLALEKLCLGRNNFGVKGCKSLAHALLTCPKESCVASRLRRIELSDNKNIGDAGIQALAKALVQIQEVVLIDANIGVEACRALAEATKTAPFKVEYLCVCGNPDIGDAGVQAISQLVVKIPEVNLQGTNMRIGGCQALAEAAEMEPEFELKNIDLSANKGIGNEGMEYLCSRIVHRLEVLRLRACKVGDKGLMALAQMAKKQALFPLKELYLSDGRIKDLRDPPPVITEQGVHHLLQFLQKCPKLEKLYIDKDLLETHTATELLTSVAEKSNFSLPYW